MEEHQDQVAAASSAKLLMEQELTSLKQGQEEVSISTLLPFLTTLLSCMVQSKCRCATLL